MFCMLPLPAVLLVQVSILLHEPNRSQDRAPEETTPCFDIAMDVLW
jgi:hypothetical protein